MKRWIFALPSCAYDSRRYLPRITAVYFILSGDDVLYVGSALCLRTRCKSHEAAKKVADRRWLKVAFLPTRDYTKTSLMEKGFVNLLRPPLNVHMFDYFKNVARHALKVAGVKPGPKPAKKGAK